VLCRDALVSQMRQRVVQIQSGAARHAAKGSFPAIAMLRCHQEARPAGQSNFF